MHACDRNSSIALPLEWGNNYNIFPRCLCHHNGDHEHQLILYISAGYETVDKLITVHAGAQ